MIERIVNRLSRAQSLSSVVISTADGAADEPIRSLAEVKGIPSFSGSESDLIDRLYRTAEEFRADAIVRVTGDCPLTDPEVVDLLVSAYVAADDLDYVTNFRPPSFPHGLDAEVYPMRTLKRLWKEVKDPLYREWFPVYLWDHRDNFRISNVQHSPDLSHLRWTVDWEDDLTFVREVYARLGSEDEFGMQEILALLDAEPELSQINTGHDRKEGYPR